MSCLWLLGCVALLSICCSFLVSASTQETRWTAERANQWYAQQPWLVGSNFLPSNAVNELEMWQADTFDPAEIDRELGWAEQLGMNTMRVFLHNLPWEQDAKGFQKRIDQFLAISAKHHIRPVFVLFDSCWDPNPKLGPQRPPIPGVHNSGWVQAPGKAGLMDAAQYPKLQAYVQGVVGAFAHDDRILAWDVWNEPDNNNDSSYGKLEPANKRDLVLALLPQVFAWARAAQPIQPLTSGVWTGDWSSIDKMSPMARVQIQESDVITFHNYGWPEEFAARVEQLQQFHRPIICTEYMARGAGSTFDTILPLAKKENVGAINWGLVKGRSQTYLPWDSWQHPYINETPPVWFHDVFYEDGTPYRAREAQIIREATGKQQPSTGQE
ncbi:cellulase family glycosylhydrolase [Occallatibacter riparius]|uniref:Cellulase family glycosylhydrolase n=1 Tax=Occallatibacter riparius TaxID=1002689 RepID=A0A9J7BT88_9BACT|nr:cellulase family glycosylhydrolase [Occallatibacter riparius]UWZ85847.1 cellulase family glycosylhydrolase [Occallatibacter riparius]